MHKDDLLRLIAEKGYDVGFGTKKHFATFDIVEKLPNWAGSIGLCVGIIQLAYPTLPLTKEIAIIFIFISIGVLYINIYNSEKERYNQAGIELTRLFNLLKQLYFEVKATDLSDLSAFQTRLTNIENEFYAKSITKQVFLSDWYAHFKFFNEMQIAWIDEQIKFKFFKDKLPKSFSYLFIIIALTIIVSLIINSSLNGFKFCI